MTAIPIGFSIFPIQTHFTYVFMENKDISK